MTETRTVGASGVSRSDRLAEQIRRLRTRAADRQFERWMLLIGGVLMPLGFVMIFLAWVGASRTPIMVEQIDYLISGGLLGLAVTVSGGFIYFAYWQTVRIRGSERQTAALAEAIAELRTALRSDVMTHDAGAFVATYVATPSGTIFHRTDCPVVDGRDDLKPVDARNTSLRPCRICSPLEDS